MKTNDKGAPASGSSPKEYVCGCGDIFETPEDFEDHKAMVHDEYPRLSLGDSASGSSAEMPGELDHPCRQTCSGWKQGWERGYDEGFRQKVEWRAPEVQKRLSELEKECEELAKANLDLRSTAIKHGEERERKFLELEATAENWRENAMGWEKRARELEAALEKIADPRKRDHREPDAQTELYCVMNIANEALKGAPGQGAGES